MVQNLFRITVDETNYSRLLGSVPDDTLVSAAGVPALAGSRIWAQKNNSKGRQVYDAMHPGDGLVFYKVKRGIANDEGMYVGVGKVGTMRRLDEEEARTLFRTPVATLAYTVEEFRPIRRSVEEAGSLLGYTSYPQSSHRVTENRYASVDGALRAFAE